MKTKSLFAILSLVLLVIISGCKKDDYVEITGLCPEVVSTIPADGAIGVPINQVISASFNTKMDPTTITSSTFTVHGSEVEGTVTYTDSTASFTPKDDLAINHTYTGKITTKVKDVTGNYMQQDYVWTFSTDTIISPVVISTSPANNAINVALTKTVTATFNMPMDPLTINGASFTINNGALSVPGTVSFAGNTASFKPVNNLITGITYTAKISTAARNVAGTAMANDYVWTFSTGALVSPTVISTDPLNNATGVVLTKTVSATFSTPMNPATLTTSTFTLKQGSTSIAGVVSYSGSTAYFNPTTNLTAGTVYTATITTAVRNLAGTAIANNYVWTFTTGTIIAPTVILTDPLNNATGVAINKIVTATFSMPMDPLTIDASTFTIKKGLSTVAGAITYSGSVATFTPTVALSPNSIYTATITIGAKNPAGVALANKHEWTFTTVTMLAPTVISTNPLNNATGVALNKVVTATFSVPMDPLTINGTNFTLYRGAIAVAGTVTYSGTTATFTPTNNLLSGTIYTATIRTGAKNVAGTQLANNYVWTFTTITAPTVISTDPANNATGVAVSKKITATFSVPMNSTTLNTTTFTVKQGTTPVTGIVTYSGSTATFTPAADLIAGKVYTATITTGATNVAGTPLAANYVWTFSTGALLAPTVILVDPLNNATGVALNKVISATFSVPMDPLTLTDVTFTVKQGTTPVIGIVTYSGSKASFTPTTNLLSGKTYTATITTGAENVAGTPLASNYVWTFSTKAPLGPGAPDLKSAGDYGILAYSTVTNNAGASEIRNMDVGVYPGTAVTGFPPGVVINGTIKVATDPSPVPAELIQAKTDLTAAYLFAEAASSPAPVTVSGNQGGKTLAPGIYKSTSTLSVEGSDLTLDAQGDVNAVWIFQIASTFITTTGGNIVLSGGAQAKNVYWQVGSSATIGDYTSFHGNILALISITMNGYSTAVGRMLTQTGGVTLTHTNIITKP